MKEDYYFNQRNKTGVPIPFQATELLLADKTQRAAQHVPM